MRVAFYTTIRDWPWGAPDYVWHRAALKALQDGHDVFVAIPTVQRDRPEIERLRNEGADVAITPPLLLGGGRLMSIRKTIADLAPAQRSFWSRIERFQPDYLFLNQGGSFDLLVEDRLMDLIERRGVAFSVFCRLNRYDIPPDAETRKKVVALLGSAQKVLFNSRWTRRVTELQLLTHLSNGGYFTHLVRFPFDESMPWPESPETKLACVGRLDCFHKGLDVLLEGLALVDSNAPPWSCSFFGSGPDREYLEELSRHLGLPDRVRFAGRTENIQEVWRGHHLAVLTSRFEGLAVSMLEALACGRPVLRTPYGGCDEWIEDGVNGFVCPAPEPELIRDSIERALESKDRLRLMGDVAHRRIRRTLSAEPENIYFQLLEAHRGNA